MMESAPVLAACGISKQFPGTLALDSVDFSVRPGQVHGLVGENGAGKSTLMRILAGIEQPTAGTLQLDGRPVSLTSSRAASACGIAMIHQELNLLPDLSVTDNIFLGRELSRHGWLDRAIEERQAGELLERLEQPIHPRSRTGSLPFGQQQTVEIARAIALNARVLIMDEPTSALSAAEIAVLFRLVRDLKSRGVAVVYISHHLEELLAVADIVTVLRDGRLVAEADAAAVGVPWIVEKMTGGVTAKPPMKPSVGEPVFSAQDVRVGSEVRGVSFQANAGEIVGFYGLLGSGRTPLFESIAGLRALDGGEIRLRGRNIGGMNIAQRFAAGIALLPESRQRDAIVPELSVRENMMLASRAGVYVSPAEERRQVRDRLLEMRIRAGDLESPITSLSGGNQQKVVLARYLMTAPQLLLLDEPTCGVDIGARFEIYEVIRQMAGRGMAVLFASSDLQEVMTLANRIVVLAAGRIAAEFAATEATEQALVAASAPAVECPHD